MLSFDDVKKYLPQYLSAVGQQELFSELKEFPHNIDQRIYTSSLACENSIFQGDGISNLLYINFPSTEVRPVTGMVLSNTCDIEQSNQRFTSMRMVYAPIVNLEKYKNVLIKEHVETNKKTIQSIESHISDLQKQYISHIFYLPKSGGLANDSIVFLDRINNCPSDSVDSNSITNQKLFTLSDYGFYLFLFKISVHFTRIRDGVVRTPLYA